MLKELHHLCYWLVRTYAPEVSRDGAAWQDERVPQPDSQGGTTSRKELQALEAKLAEQNRVALQKQKEQDALNEELQTLRQQLAEIRKESEAKPDSHDYTEAETRDYLIDVELRRAGWPLDQTRDREYEVTGMPNAKGIGYVDYVLWGEDGKPLAVVEAKKTTADPKVGQQQAKLYADCLETMHGQRPVIFFTSGYVIWLWDDVNYPPRRVAGFYKCDELQRLVLRRSQRKNLDVSDIKDAIVERYYQKRAIGSIFEQMSTARRKALLVMATGTGKTRTAIALVDVLQRALDRKKRKVVYTDFQDEVLGVREEQALFIPKMTGAQYQKKVEDYLKSHLDDLVIHRLRMNEPLTPVDLKELEITLQSLRAAFQRHQCRRAGCCI